MTKAPNQQENRGTLDRLRNINPSTKKSRLVLINLGNIFVDKTIQFLIIETETKWFYNIKTMRNQHQVNSRPIETSGWR